MDSTYSKLASYEKDIESVDDVYHIVKPSSSNNKKKCCARKCKAKKCAFRICKIICILMSMIFMFTIAFAAIVGYKVNKFIAQEVQKWTVTEPMSLPIDTDIPKSELKAFKRDAKAFFKGIEYGKNVDDFTVQASYLNGLVAGDHHLRGNLYGEMKTNQVVVDVSLPMDGLPGGKGRYLVGTETLTWDPESSILHINMDTHSVMSSSNMDGHSLSDDAADASTLLDLKFHLTLRDDKTLDLQVISGKFLEWTIPQDFIDEHINVLEDLYDCDCHDRDCKRMRKFLFGLEDISLEENQVVFHTRNKPYKMMDKSKDMKNGPFDMERKKNVMGKYKRNEPIDMEKTKEIKNKDMKNGPFDMERKKNVRGKYKRNEPIDTEKTKEIKNKEHFDMEKMKDIIKNKDMKNKPFDMEKMKDIKNMKPSDLEQAKEDMKNKMEQAKFKDMKNKDHDGHHHRDLEEMKYTPSNKPGWKFHYARRLLGF